MTVSYYSLMPEYLRLAELLRHDIAMNYRSGQRYLSQNDLIARYGVSYGTVAKALSVLVSEGWIYRVVGSGTYVSDLCNEQKDQQKTIGVLLCGHKSNIDFSPFIADICKYIISAANKLDYKVQILPSWWQRLAQRDRFLAQTAIDGLICFNPNSLPAQELDTLAEKMPIVFSERFDMASSTGRKFGWCDIDTETGIGLGVDYLLSHGHRRIALILGNTQYHPLYLRRLESYRKKLEDSGIAYDPALVYEADSFSYKAGIEAIEALLPAAPDAVLISSASFGIGAINTIRKNHLQIPQDISVVGYDEQFYFSPSFQCLSCVESPIRDFAEALVSQIIALIGGKSVNGCLLQPYLLRGRSVADKNAGRKKTP